MECSQVLNFHQFLLASVTPAPISSLAIANAIVWQHRVWPPLFPVNDNTRYENRRRPPPAHLVAKSHTMVAYIPFSPSPPIRDPLTHPPPTPAPLFFNNNNEGRVSPTGRRSVVAPQLGIAFDMPHRLAQPPRSYRLLVGCDRAVVGCYHHATAQQQQPSSSLP